MSSVPRSPFVNSRQMTTTSGNNEAFGRVGNDAYAYWDNDPEIQEPPGNNHQDWNLQRMGEFAPAMKPWDYILISFGPAADDSVTLNFGLPYQPSNGLVSNGEIFLTNGGVNNENATRKQN